MTNNDTKPVGDSGTVTYVALRGGVLALLNCPAYQTQVVEYDTLMSAYEDHDVDARMSARLTDADQLDEVWFILDWRQTS